MTYLTTPTKRGWGWDNFDHSQTLSIGYSASTCIAYQKISFTCVVLKSCPESSYTPIRRWLAEIALAQSKDTLEKISKNSLFLPTICCFKYQNRRYVGSMLSDISLADIISCTILFQESHLASVLEQVTRALLFLQEKSQKSGTCVIYGSLQTSNIFVDRNGTVQLASFGNSVLPQQISKKNCNQDRLALGALTSHMLLQDPNELCSMLQQKMISISFSRNNLNTEFKPSPQLVDFLELCFSTSTDSLLEKVLRHPFLKGSHYPSLIPLVLNAERAALRYSDPATSR